MSATLVASTALCAAHAQTPDQDTDNDANSIIVTGRQLHDAPAQVGGWLGLGQRETPAMVEVLTQQDFQLQGVRSALEAMNAAPGLATGNLPGSVGAASMRGFHRAVNYLYDGVRMAGSGIEVRNWDAFSFERIEVIKGPASVTAGEGALAGAINFVPRKPQLDRLSGELLASGGSHRSMRLGGDINVPLGEHAALRADAVMSDSRGWVRDTDSSTVAGRIALRVQPTQRLDITVSLDRFEDEFRTAYYGTPLVAASSARDPSGLVSGSSGLVLDKAMVGLNYNVDDGRMDSQTTWLRARVDYRIAPGWSLSSDSSLYDSSRLWRDADGYGFDSASAMITREASLITHEHDYWNQRFQLSFDGQLAGRHNRFIAGMEVGATDFFTMRRFGSAGMVDAYSPVRGRFPSGAEAFDTLQDVTADVTSRAWFMENAFNLTPKLLLVGSLRLDDVELEREVKDVDDGTVTRYGQDYDPLTWRAGVVYSLRPQVQLFAQYTRAATPVSGLLTISASNARFDVSMGTSHEAGIKATLMAGVDLTASLFRIRQNDIVTRDPLNPAVTMQGGSQSVRGAEASLYWALSSALNLTLGASWLEAEFDTLIEAGGADRSGNRPANTPQVLADLALTYAPPSWPVSFTGIVRHNGDFYTANANDVRVGAFTVLDASAAWRTPVGVVTLRGRNLTDELYVDWSGYASGLVFVGEPRSYEVSFTRSF